MITEPCTIAAFLDRTLWAPSLTPQQRERVGNELSERVVPAGGFGCRKAEPVDHWIGVMSGLLKMSSVSPEGKTVTFTGMGPGGWFGEGSLLKTETRKYDVVALRESRLAYMPRATFTWLLDTSIAFNRFLLMQLNERLGLFISLVEYDRMLDPDMRVARCLAALFNPYLNPHSGLQLQISQEEIGYLCGTSRQRANQALQVLEKDGLLSVDYGGITILNLAGLRVFGG
ncbi:Crp/Fnr family transcriptional regulator [Actimicrobium antarcticum]|uniref:Crp/Fnr family transcriptional regulator n=1 Tax=Actimicrobium antarcticum TaxID=1051899 RepID=A0ABP7T553_9BURK